MWNKSPVRAFGNARELADAEKERPKYISKGVMQGDCNSMSNQNHSEITDTARLTRREIEILSLIVEGHSSKKVAELLFVSKRTVDFHLDNIYEKLQVTNRMQALQRATRLGLLPRTA